MVIQCQGLIRVSEEFPHKRLRIEGSNLHQERRPVDPLTPVQILLDFLEINCGNQHFLMAPVFKHFPKSSIQCAVASGVHLQVTTQERLEEITHAKVVGLLEQHSIDAATDLF